MASHSDERVGQPDLDERLPGHAESTGFLIDLAQEAHRDIDVHALHGPAGANGLADVHMRRQVNASVMHGIEFGGGG